MPDMTAHYLHATQVLSRLRGMPGELPPLETRAFLLGAQGPDPLYYHRDSRSPERRFVPLAEKLHAASPKELFSRIRDAGGQEDAAVFAGYAAGFYCHLTLDEAVVPFLRAAAAAHDEAYPEEKENPEALRLARVRAVQDVILLRRETGMLPMEFSLPQVFPKDRALWETLSAGLERALGGEMTRQEIARAFGDTHRCLRRLNDRTGYKITVKKFFSKCSKKLRRTVAHMRPLTEPDSFDYVNEEHGVWLDGAGNERTESLFELFDDSCERAAETLCAWLCP